MYHNCREDQEVVLDKISEWLKSDNESEACLSLATGMGKTKVALESIARYNLKPVIWSTHKLTLLEQSSAEELVQSIMGHYGKDCKVGILSGERKDGLEDADIVFVSAGMMEEDDNILKELKSLNPQLFIIDEAHNKREIYKKIRSEFKTLNLTATPYDPVTLEKMDLGTNVGSKTYKEAVDMKVCIPVTFAHFDLSKETGESSKIWENIQDKENVNFILDKVESFIKGERTLMCLKNLKEVKSIQEELSKRGMSYGVISSNEKSDLELNKDLLRDKPDGYGYRAWLLNKLKKGEIDGLLNYDVLIEGIDIPELTRAVSFRPLDTANKFAQLVGRLARKAPGKSGAMCIDIADAEIESGKEVLNEVVRGRKYRHMAAVLNAGDPIKVTETQIYENSHYNINEVIEFQKTNGKGRLPLPINPDEIEEENNVVFGEKQIKFRELDFNKEDIVYLPKGVPLSEDVLELKRIQDIRAKRAIRLREKVVQLSQIELFKDMAKGEVTENGFIVDGVAVNFEKVEEDYRMSMKSTKNETKPQSLFFKKGAANVKLSNEIGESMEKEKNTAFLEDLLGIPQTLIHRVVPPDLALLFTRFLKKNNTKGFKKSCRNGVMDSSLWDRYSDSKQRLLGIGQLV